MHPSFGRLIIYTKKISEMVDFYRTHFGFQEHRIEGDRIVELRPSDGGFSILLHPASKGQRDGQSLVKIVFDVEDVPAFCEQAKLRGLVFGSIHGADGYCYANAKDPSKNSVTVSSRAFVT
ncbi:MAG: VOC family protein [Hyphomicrobiales bacterium]